MNTDRCDHKVKKFFPYSFSLFHFLLPSLHLPPPLFTPSSFFPYYRSPLSLLLTPSLITPYYFPLTTYSSPPYYLLLLSLLLILLAFDVHFLSFCIPIS